MDAGTPGRSAPAGRSPLSRHLMFFGRYALYWLPFDSP